ncbi:MAG: ATP-dependent sacrificial sulfur transferase LarE [Lachnospiraceae bacterium]|nr:ATP-dependent sacrificial sulfur transferase LarE [Lachnospiraceae bacterium]
MDKEKVLREYIKNLGSVAVAFSGGVDSTFLLQVALDTLGREHVVAVIATSCFVSERETEGAIAFCREKQIPYEVVEIYPLGIEGIGHNPANRCYLCKKVLCQQFLEVAKARGMQAVAEGSNLDDEGDYRPGMQAVTEMGIHSPLRATGWTKSEIREASRQLGLPTAEKPANACLATRFAYGDVLNEERLHMVDEAEQLLEKIGVSQRRVRVHNQGTQSIARIEVTPEDFSLISNPETAGYINTKFQELGFLYVTMDLGGFSSGKMNQTLR